MSYLGFLSKNDLKWIVRYALDSCLLVPVECSRDSTMDEFLETVAVFIKNEIEHGTHRECNSPTIVESIYEEIREMRKRQGLLPRDKLSCEVYESSINTLKWVLEQLERGYSDDLEVSERRITRKLRIRPIPIPTKKQDK